MIITKEYLLKGPGRVYLVSGIGLLVVGAATGLLTYQLRRDSSPKVVVTSTPTPSPESSPSTEPSPTESATSTPSPSVSPVSSPTSTANDAEAPETVQLMIARFYTSYKEKDRTTIASYFTDDTSDELRSLHARLFTGIDLDGSPGGPTLFATNSASESVTAYTIVSAQSVGRNWKITVKESRLTGGGQSAGDSQFVLVLVPNKTTWSIDQYYHASASGKYDGFLSQ